MLINSRKEYNFWIFIDVNGGKSPNRLGKDIFMTELKQNKRLVMLWNQKNRNILINGTNYACKKGTHADYAGGYCGSLIQYDGWQINDDYPWYLFIKCTFTLI